MPLSQQSLGLIPHGHLTCRDAFVRTKHDHLNGWLRLGGARGEERGAAHNAAARTIIGQKTMFVSHATS